jgi:hypothetical protein
MRRVAVTRIAPPLALAVVGVVLATAWSSTAAQAAGFALVGIACVIAVSLAFLEIGLSEDRERARAQRRQAASAEERDAAPREARSRWPARRGRRRGHG